MTIVKQTLRFILIIHGFLNVVQGAYCIIDPAGFAEMAGPGFGGASDQALQSIGMIYLSLAVEFTI